MSSTCTIRAEATGEPTTDPESGKVTPAEGDIVYAGPCRVRPAGTVQDSRESGGDELFAFDYQVSIPFSATGVTEGHRVTIDSSPDPALIGRELDVEQVGRGDTLTARRLACKEVS